MLLLYLPDDKNTVLVLLLSQIDYGIVIVKGVLVILLSLYILLDLYIF